MRGPGCRAWTQPAIAATTIGMQVSTKLTFIVCSLGLVLGGCARTSPDRAPSSNAPDDDPSYSEEMPVDPVVDSVGNSSRLKASPGAELPAPATQDIGNPGGRIDKSGQPVDPLDPNEPSDTTSPNPTNPVVPPPSGG